MTSDFPPGVRNRWGSKKIFKFKTTCSSRQEDCTSEDDTYNIFNSTSEDGTYNIFTSTSEDDIYNIFNTMRQCGLQQN